MDDKQEHEAVMETLKLAKICVVAMCLIYGVLERETLLSLII